MRGGFLEGLAKGGVGRVGGGGEGMGDGLALDALRVSLRISCDCSHT